MKKSKTKAKRFKLILEFLIFGLVVGVIEDLIAVKFATGETITWKMVGILFLVTIPFAILSEIIIDSIDFTSLIHRFILKKDNKKK